MVMLLIPCLSHGATISLSKEQFDNLDVIDIALKQQYPTYTSLNGTKNKITFYGINDGTQLKTFINSLDLNSLKQNDPKRKKVKKVRNKLKALGIDDEDLATMGLVTDIPDGV